jgi:hypothetical protein
MDNPFVSDFVRSLGNSRALLSSFTALHLTVVAVNLLMQLNCGHSGLCGTQPMRVAIQEISSFPIFSLTSMVRGPFMIDAMSGVTMALTVLVGGIVGVLNSLSAGWILRAGTTLIVRRFRSRQDLAFALIVTSTGISCLSTLWIALGGPLYALIAFGIMCLIAYGAVRGSEACAGAYKAWFSQGAR